MERLAQAALARGYLSPAQLTRARGEASSDRLLAHLAAHYLSPEQVAALRELAAVDAGARTQDGSLAPSSRPATPGSGGSGVSLPQRAASAEELGQLGPYRIERELARGGMGAIYVAHHVELGRKVALKTTLLQSPRAAARFKVEAEAMAKLRHENVVAVHEAGTEEGRHFLAMELVEGGSLGDRVDQGRVDERDAARWIAQAARGIAAAHAVGVLHRDLKPDNVLVSREGRALVTDFGLAKDLEAEAELTRTGQVLGTPAYMPPEQAKGDHRAVDERSDVYSLGATLYAALTGDAPFDGDSAMNVLVAVCHRPPELPSRRRRGLDRTLEAICLKCLEKDPAARYSSAGELADELEAWASGGSVRARVRTRWRPVLAGAGVLVALALFLAQRGSEGAESPAPPAPPGSSPSPSLAPSLAAAPSATPESTAREEWLRKPRQVIAHPDCRGAAFVPGGRLLTWGAGIRLWQLDPLRELRRWGTGYLVGYLVLDVERELAYFNGGQQRVVRVLRFDQERFRTLFKAPRQVHALALDPQRRLLAVGDEENVSVLAVPEGAQVHRLSGHGSRVVSLAFGREVLASACGLPLDKEGHPDNAVRLWDLESGSLLRRIHFVAMPQVVAFHPNAYLLAVGTDGSRMLLYDTVSGNEAGIFRGEGANENPLKPISAHIGTVRAISFNRGGDLVLSGSGSPGVRAHNGLRLWRSADRGELWRVTARAERYRHLAWSPSGLRFAATTAEGVELWDLGALKLP